MCAGNRARILGMVQALKRLGHHVAFIYLDCGKPVDWQAMQTFYGEALVRIPIRAPQELGEGRAADAEGADKPLPVIRYVLPHGLVLMLDRWVGRWSPAPDAAAEEAQRVWNVDDWFDASALEPVRQVLEQQQPDMVVGEYVFDSRIFEIVPKGCVKCLDTHDVFSRRADMLSEHGIRTRWFTTSPEQEGRALGRADIVLGITHRDCEALSALTATPVMRLGHMPPQAEHTIPHPAHRQEEHRPTLSFIGSRNELNAHGLRWFLDTCWRTVRERVPDVQLHVAGTCVHVEDLWHSRQGIVLHPYVDLDVFYASADLLINPQKAGTGLKIKTYEALMYGKAMVGTSVAAVDLEDGICVCDTTNAFTEAVTGMLLDPGQRQAQEKKARLAYGRYKAEVAEALDHLLVFTKEGVS